MVLSRLTKITGPGVATDTNWVGNNADFTGITTTATSFNIGVTTIHSNLIEAHNIKSTGIITATGGSFSGNVTAVDGTFTGNVSIAGTLTYEDVTNIDSVGIITAPALDVDDFLDVGSSIKLGNAGVITATSFVGSGAALTGIDATAIKDSGGNVKVQAQASGAIHSGVSTFQDIDVDGHTNLDNVSIAGVTTITSSTFPLNVHADTNYQGILINGNNAPTLGFNTADNDTPKWKIGLSGSNQNDLAIGKGAGNTNQFRMLDAGGASLLGTLTAEHLGIDGHLYHNGDTDTRLLFGTDTIDLKTGGSTRLRAENSGVNITGIVTATSADINGDLDVDGHTNLDNVSIAGVVTATSFVGSGANLTSLPAQATIANNADNRVITGGSGVNLNGEANLTWDGAQLYMSCGNYSYPIVINSVQSSVRAVIRQTNDGNANSGLAIQKKHSSLHPANHWYGDISFEGWDGSGYHKGGLIECVANGTPANNNMPGELRFSTNAGAASPTKILTITKGGSLYHTGGGNDRRYSFATDGTAHYLSFDNTLNGIKLNGYGGIAFETNGTNERLRIGSAGQIGIAGANYGTSGQVLTSQGSGSAVQWATPAAATNSPSFSAYRTGDYTAGNGSESILQFNNTRFNTGSCYSTGNYKFTPNVAGSYVFHLNFFWFGSTTSNMLQSAFARIKKNGNTIATFWIDPNDSSRENRLGMSVTAMTDMNGSSDYVEPFGYGLTGAGDPRFSSDGSLFGGFKLA